MGRTRKWLAVLTAAVLLSGAMTGAALAFTDVPPHHEAAGAFNLLKGLEIYRGYPDGSAGPANPIRRDEFCAVVVRMIGQDRLAGTVASLQPTFPDAIPNWAWGYVNVATSLEIIRGYDDKTFRPANPVTFAEAFAMLSRALKLDEAATGTWPLNYIALAGLVGLDIGLQVSPNAPITRAEMALATRNALVSRWTHQKGVGLKPGLALLERAPYGWTAAAVDDVIATLAGGTAGKVTSVLPTSARVTIAGREYGYVKTGFRFFLNGADITGSAGYANADAGLDKLRADGKIVTPTLDANGRLIRVSWTEDRENQLITAVTVSAGETAFGTITIGGVAVNVSPTAPELWVNGQRANVAALKAALDALRATYGVAAPAAATVRTLGNQAIAANNVQYIDAWTTKVVTGVVTVLGSDAGGNFFRITVGGTSHKYYYLGITPAAGPDAVTFLFSPTNVAVRILTEPAALPSVLWVRVTAVEHIGNKLVRVTAHTSGMSPQVSADLYGRTTVSGGTTQYLTDVNPTHVALNRIAAVKLTGAGRVDLITGITDPAWSSADFTGGDTPPSRLHWGNGAGAINLVGGIHTIQLATAGSEAAAETVFATDTVIIVRANGSPSTKTLAALRADPALVSKVYYVLQGGLRTAQIIQTTE